MAHHWGVQQKFVFKTESEYHDTGIAVVGYPLKVEPNESFEVELAVICLTAGCDLTGKKIHVGASPTGKEFEGTLTWKAWNARYMKWEYHGKVKCEAPEKLGSYEWYGTFFTQSRHRGSRTRIGL